MATFDDFLDAVKGGLDDLISNTIGDFADSAKERAENFLAETGDDLKKWMEQLADDEISEDDFEFLVKRDGGARQDKRSSRDWRRKGCGRQVPYRVYSAP